MLLEDLELALTDLLQTGFATAGPDTADRMAELSRRCEATGLHTGALLFGGIAELLRRRSHSVEKSDRELAGALCRAEHYITLCQERLMEEDIRSRWQEGGQT